MNIETAKHIVRTATQAIALLNARITLRETKNYILSQCDASEYTTIALDEINVEEVAAAFSAVLSCRTKAEFIKRCEALTLTEADNTPTIAEALANLDQALEAAAEALTAAAEDESNEALQEKFYAASDAVDEAERAVFTATAKKALPLAPDSRTRELLEQLFAPALENRMTDYRPAHRIELMERARALAAA